MFEYVIIDGYINITGVKDKLIKSIDIPEFINDLQVRYINHKAFYGLSRLESVIIPNSVIFIGSSAFKRCKSLTNIIIPNSVKYIGRYAFNDSYSLNEINGVEVINGCNIINNKFIYRNCDNLRGVFKIVYQINDDYHCKARSCEGVNFYIKKKLNV